MIGEKTKNKNYTNILLILMIFAVLYFYAYPAYYGGGSIISFEKSTQDLIKENSDYKKAFLKLKENENDLLDVNQEYKDFKKKNIDPATGLELDFSKIFPEELSPVEVINELDRIAKNKESNMRIDGPRFTDSGELASKILKYNTITVNFSVKGTYSQLKNFLTNIEKSQRVYNITSLSFSSSEDSTDSSVFIYDITLETYYLLKK